MELLKEENFRHIIDDKKTGLFTLRNKNGCVAQFTNYGARWLSMWVPDRNGKWDDVILGFDKLDGYLSANDRYHGAVVGRVCGRISGGQFSLGGITYSLSNNDIFGKPVKNHLHGGDRGFSFQVWDAEVVKNNKDEEMLVLNYFSKDGEEGYPGNLKVTVTYTLSGDNTVKMQYIANCDQFTVINLTNHAYVNLSGNRADHVLNHLLFIHANTAIDCNDELVPTGKLIPVKNTALDFTRSVPIGARIHENIPGQLYSSRGYNVAYILQQINPILQPSAVVTDTDSGRRMELLTDQPVLQLYNAWLFDGTDIGKNGKKYEASAGLALEAQGYTDAPNHTNFPSVALTPGDTYRQETIYRFLIQPEG